MASEVVNGGLPLDFVVLPMECGICQIKVLFSQAKNV